MFKRSIYDVDCTIILKRFWTLSHKLYCTHQSLYLMLSVSASFRRYAVSQFHSLPVWLSCISYFWANTIIRTTASWKGVRTFAGVWEADVPNGAQRRITRRRFGDEVSKKMVRPQRKSLTILLAVDWFYAYIRAANFSKSEIPDTASPSHRSSLSDGPVHFPLSSSPSPLFSPA